MIVHQISIFVENKSGTLLKVLELFKEKPHTAHRIHHLRHGGVRHLPHHLFGADACL